jgi:hypothetical protein
MEVYGFNYSNIFFLLAVETVDPIFPIGSGIVDYDLNVPYTFQEGVSASGLPFNNPFIPVLATDATFSVNFPDWISTINNKLDLRGFYLKVCETGVAGVNGYCPAITFPTDVLTTTSSISGNTVAYSTEAIFYAQSGYFASIVLIQWSNVFACKSRKVQPDVCRLPLRNHPLTPICLAVWDWKPS